MLVTPGTQGSLEQIFTPTRIREGIKLSKLSKGTAGMVGHFRVKLFVFLRPHFSQFAQRPTLAE